MPKDSTVVFRDSESGIEMVVDGKPLTVGIVVDSSEAPKTKYFTIDDLPHHPSKDLVPKGSSFEIPGEVVLLALERTRKPFPLVSVLFKEENGFSMRFTPYDSLTHEEYEAALIPKVWPPEVSFIICRFAVLLSHCFIYRFY